jgi:hypothetical protein
VDRVHVSVDRPGVLGPPWTDGSANRGGAGARWHAHRSSASDCSGAPKLTGGGAKGRGEHGELGSGITELVRRCGGRAMVVQNWEAVALGEDTAQAWRERKRSGGRCGATRGWYSPFIGAGGASGRGGQGG